MNVQLLTRLKLKKNIIGLKIIFFFFKFKLHDLKLISEKATKITSSFSPALFRAIWAAWFRRWAVRDALFLKQVGIGWRCLHSTIVLCPKRTEASKSFWYISLILNYCTRSILWKLGKTFRTLSMSSSVQRRINCVSIINKRNEPYYSYISADKTVWTWLV